MCLGTFDWFSGLHLGVLNLIRYPNNTRCQSGNRETNTKSFDRAE